MVAPQKFGSTIDSQQTHLRCHDQSGREQPLLPTHVVGHIVRGLANPLYVNDWRKIGADGRRPGWLRSLAEATAVRSLMQNDVVLCSMVELSLFVAMTEKNTGWH